MSDFEKDDGCNGGTYSRIQADGKRSFKKEKGIGRRSENSQRGKGIFPGTENRLSEWDVSGYLFCDSRNGKKHTERGEKSMPGSGQTQGVLNLTQYVLEDPIDLIGDYNADMKKIADFAQAQVDKEGLPGGIATLDSAGKLMQMPTAADVSAQPQTEARDTMVKADASGTLVAAEFDDFAPGIQFENPSGMDYTNVWKFPNGLMIVTKTVYLDKVAITTQLEGYCVSNTRFLGAIPKFAERPYLTANVFGYDGQLIWVANLSYGNGDDKTAVLPNIRLASNYSRTGDFYVNIQAIGRWK